MSHPVLSFRMVTLILFAATLSGCHSPVPAAAVDSRVTAAGDETELIRVPSRDGTLIAVECTGTGPTLLMVHGGVGDRTRWTPMFPLLSPHFTACAMDRRGRGGSGDSAEYSLRKEAEDVAAVVNSRPGTVIVLGHSYGAVAALEAAFLTNRIAKMILYEAPLHEPVAPALAMAEKIERLVSAGNPEQAVVTFQTEIVHQSAAEIAAMKARPSWPTLVATVGLQVRQMRALASFRFDAARMVALKVPTLLLIGGETANPHMKESMSSLHAALPNPTLVVLEGQQHNAMDSAREALAGAIIKFATTSPGTDQ